MKAAARVAAVAVAAVLARVDRISA
jgi:hypothetical protein